MAKLKSEGLESSKFDVSVVLNIHRESRYLLPTLKSLSASALFAKSSGISVELVAVFDNHDQETWSTFQRNKPKGFDAVRVVKVKNRSLGLSRNSGVEVARGEYCWTADADDLASENSIVKLFQTAKSSRGDSVVFLEYLIGFGKPSYHISKYVGSELLSPTDFIERHPYISRVFLKRSDLLANPYVALPLTKGFAFEDWDLNNRLLAKGFKFLIAPETLFFYRHREDSMLRESNRLQFAEPPQSILHEPEFLLRAHDSASSSQKNKSAHPQREAVAQSDLAAEISSNPSLAAFVADAAALEPEVKPSLVLTAHNYIPFAKSLDHWGSDLVTFYKLVGTKKFDEVILLPHLNAGGAEKYIIQVVDSIISMSKGTRRVLVVSGESASSHSWVSKLPKGSQFIDVYNFFPRLSEGDRDKLVVRALLGLAADGARLHIKASSFGYRVFGRYGLLLKTRFETVLYRFCDDRSVYGERWVANPWTLQFIRLNLGNLDLVITDCDWVRDSDLEIVGSEVEAKYKRIYAHTEPPISVTKVQKKINLRLLWASRISAQKRPELLPRIMYELGKSMPNISLDVYGSMERGVPAEVVTGHPTVFYKGPFENWGQIPIESYDAFVYTAAFDGLPNVLLEAMASGLPIIAPNLGGISELADGGRNLRLVPDEVSDQKLVRYYVDAIKRVYEDVAETAEMVRNGRAFIERQHSIQRHREDVSRVFRLTGE